MNQLYTLKVLLGNPDELDEVLQYYLDLASDVICDIRNSNEVEAIYLTTQIKIAMELYGKRGAEGQTSHAENGISRSYERAEISPSLLSQIIPMARTPFSTVRNVNK